jgi:hypothetical protein
VTPHDQRAATDPTQSVEPEFSSTGTEAPRMSDERPVESDPIVDDASSARAEQSQAGEVSPAEAEPAQAGEVPPAAAEPAHAREVPPSADVQPSSENDVQPSSENDVQPSGDELLFAADPSGLRSRWDDIQAAFVDDPTECVQKADALVEEVVEQLTAAFSEARSRLEAQWARGEHASTEDLRVALQRYREFFQRLLAV